MPLQWLLHCSVGKNQIRREFLSFRRSQPFSLVQIAVGHMFPSVNDRKTLHLAGLIMNARIMHG